MRVSVLIVGMHEDAQSFLMAGTLTKEEITLLTELILSGPRMRERIVSAFPTSNIARIIQQIYLYEKDGDIYFEDHDKPGTGDFVEIDAKECWNHPMHVIVWSLWD